MKIAQRIILKGRPISKKNNRIASNNRFFTTSARYKQWENEALWQLKGIGPVKTSSMHVTFGMKGKMDADLDNLVTSVLDVLQKARVIENDRYITHIDARKQFGNPDWVTEIML